MELSSIGILPAKVKQFNKKGIFSVEDLIEFFPRKYYDCTKVTGVTPERDMNCFVMHVTDVKEYDGKVPMFMASGYEVPTHRFVKVCWFRQNYMYPYIAKTIGADVYVCGKAVYNEQYKKSFIFLS